VHAAFVAAAAGGPSAAVAGRLLVADELDRQAVCWLEESGPLGMRKPPLAPVIYTAKRHRVRAAVEPKLTHDYHRNETDFEPFCAVGGQIVFAWPRPSAELVKRLDALARDITHVGRADSTAIVRVWEDEFSADEPDAYAVATGRGNGYQLRVPLAGRFQALAEAHKRSQLLGNNRHGAGQKNKQALDEIPQGIGALRTELRRFAPRAPGGPWPYGEVWRLTVAGLTAHDLRVGRRVQSAVRIHRALVVALGSDVPEFVTGRSGEGPAGGAGHLAIQFPPPISRANDQVLLALPSDVPDADRARLLGVLGEARSLRFGRKLLRIRSLEVESGAAFWASPARLFATAVPLMLDTPGTPRHAPWTLDEATVCSVGYALRGVLEREGLEWGSGWDFRRHLVAELRRRGVEAHASRVLREVDRFVHHSREGDLLVAVHALVTLGELAGAGRGLLSLGRARHLGGGLLVPLGAEAGDVHA
jgi:CRISPR-associated protein Csb2